MADTAQAIVTAVLVLATSIWVGGYVAIAVVARTAAGVLEPASRVTFFRSLGRSYFWVGLPALVIALVAGGVLVRDHAVDAVLVTTAVTAIVLLLTLAVAVVQARRMTRLRQRSLGSPDDVDLGARVQRGARTAAVLRALLGVLSVALVVLGAFLAT